MKVVKNLFAFAMVVIFVVQVYKSISKYSRREVSGYYNILHILLYFDFI